MTAANRDDLVDDALTGGAATQRLDKWIWFARVIKTRTQAAALVSQGKVRVNRGKSDKPSQAVRAGDVLTIAVGSRIRILEVLAIGVKRGSATDAQALFKDLTPASSPRRAITEPDPLQGPNAVRDPGTGRPTKRDRRKLDRLQDG